MSTDDKLKYPLLMKGIISGRIINMTEYDKGTVVGSGHERYPVRLGKFSDTWSMGSFKPFKG